MIKGFFRKETNETVLERDGKIIYDKTVSFDVFTNYIEAKQLGVLFDELSKGNNPDITRSERPNTVVFGRTHKMKDNEKFLIPDAVLDGLHEPGMIVVICTEHNNYATNVNFNSHPVTTKDGIDYRVFRRQDMRRVKIKENEK
jgi:hypothetical protein